MTKMALGVPFVLFALIMPPIRLQLDHRHAVTAKGPDQDDAGSSSASHSIREEDASLISVEGGQGRGQDPGLCRLLTFLLTAPRALSWWKEHVSLRHILTSYVWNCNNCGYVFVEWVLQTLSFWGPKAMLELYPQHSSSVSDSLLGISSLIAGTVGSIAGGLMLDFFGNPFERKDQDLVDFKMAFFLSLIFSVIGALLLFASFYPRWSLWIFFAASCLSLTSLSAISPLNYALAMDSVPCRIRPMSLAAMIAFQRVAGDMTAPPMTGYLQSATHDWHITISIVALSLLGAGVFFGLGFMFKHPHEYPHNLPPQTQEANETLALLTHTDGPEAGNGSQGSS